MTPIGAELLIRGAELGRWYLFRASSAPVGIVALVAQSDRATAS
jgi:hypothetical protein